MRQGNASTDTLRTFDEDDYVPFDYATVIALPLLLGVGADNGIYIVQRARSSPPACPRSSLPTERPRGA